MVRHIQHAGRRRHRGFTLVELLVSLLILSLALISLSQLYLAGMWTTQKARYLSIATQRAQAELERTQDLGLLTLQLGATEDAYPLEEYVHHSDKQGVDFVEEGLPKSHGTVTWSNYPVGAQANEHLLKVNVNLTWEGASRSRSQVEVMTFLTNKY